MPGARSVEVGPWEERSFIPPVVEKEPDVVLSSKYRLFDAECSTVIDSVV